jgi:hypothetical protein
VAVAGAVVLHVPPATLELSEEAEPTHRLVEPDMVAWGLTVTVLDDTQPAPVVNDITVVPLIALVTRPEPFTVATDELLLLHAPPPAVLLVNVAVWPWHIGDTPTVCDSAFTVTVCVVAQPVDGTYVSLATPAATPVSTPPDVIVANAAVLVLQLPPLMVGVSVIV